MGGQISLPGSVFLIEADFYRVYGYIWYFIELEFLMTFYVKLRLRVSFIPAKSVPIPIEWIPSSHYQIYLLSYLICCSFLVEVNGAAKIYGKEFKDEHDVRFMKIEKMLIDFKLKKSRFRIRDIQNHGNVIGMYSRQSKLGKK